MHVVGLVCYARAPRARADHWRPGVRRAGGRPRRAGVQAIARAAGRFDMPLFVGQLQLVGHRAGQARLAAARLTLDQQRALQKDRQVHRLDQRRAGQVRRRASRLAVAWLRAMLSAGWFNASAIGSLPRSRPMLFPAQRLNIGPDWTDLNLLKRTQFAQKECIKGFLK